MSPVLTDATLIDCISPDPVPDASVVIEDGRIAEITYGGRVPSVGNPRLLEEDV